MDTIEAIEARRSVRAFLPNPIKQDTLETILAAAARTPSWANTQPWETFVLSGDAVAELRAAFQEAHEQRQPGRPELDPPKHWTDYCKAGTADLREAQKRDCGEDFKSFGRQNQALFDAPAIIYPCMDKALGHWSLYDLGAYAQTLMLAAQDFGIDSIAAYTLTIFPEIVHRVAKIPDNLEVTIGLALGYADPARGLNRLQSPRRSLDESVRWVD
ncbi:MAG: nitroreductase [Coriobacteriales bacterium]|jgi:nitroreductase|nr:nitroreductase [Coriobacteriales bacterium]